MKQAKNGDVVKVHYTGKHLTGEIFDSSVGREPLEFALGAGQMIQGFEKAILGMEIGNKKTINISEAEGYGQVDEDLYFRVEKDQIPEDLPLELGMFLNVQADNGMPVQVVVKEINPIYVILDANHPLAGKELVFEIELLEINSADDAQKKPFLFD